MCIVVDINTLVPVFDESCDLHPDFVHVKNWIESGRGYLVFGGTKFKQELQKTYRYLRLIRQMKEAGQALAVRDDVVDAEEARVKNRTEGTDCDDQHIIALLGASRCPLLCSADKRSYKYVRNRDLYPEGMPRVRIYSSKRNRSLLSQSVRINLLRNLNV